MTATNPQTALAPTTGAAEGAAPGQTMDPAAYTDDAPEFSPAVRAILSTPVDPALVETREPGDLQYVPWIHYQTILLAAFGHGGWRLIPRGPARTEGRDVTWTGALFVRAPGQTKFQFIKEAKGACNGSIGANAVEGAQSDCLTKCCKGLHIFMELFDPAWRRAWEAKYRPTHEKARRAAAWPSARPDGAAAGGVASSATPPPVSPSSTDTGEAATAEQKEAIKDQLKALGWKLGFVRIWFAERFGLDTKTVNGQRILDALTYDQADNAHLLLGCHGKPIYERVLEELRGEGVVS